MFWIQITIECPSKLFQCKVALLTNPIGLGYLSNFVLTGRDFAVCLRPRFDALNLLLQRKLGSFGTTRALTTFTLLTVCLVLSFKLVSRVRGCSNRGHSVAALCLLLVLL